MKRSLAAQANNGAWWAQLDPATSERVDKFFGVLQQAASRIDELEPPVTDPAQLFARIDRDLAALEPLMKQIVDAFQGLVYMGNPPRGKFDDTKVGEYLSDFRNSRRQAAEILLPMERYKDQMTAVQRETFDRYYDHLTAMIREVRSGMMLDG